MASSEMRSSEWWEMQVILLDLETLAVTTTKNNHKMALTRPTDLGGLRHVQKVALSCFVGTSKPSMSCELH